MTRSLVIAAVSAAAALFAGAANAGSVSIYDASQNIVTINTTGLDIHSSDGARVLAERVRIAAWKVCGGDNPLARADSDFDKCRREAIDRAIASFASPELARVLGRPTEQLAQQR
jgi:UrcA family protein